MIEELTGNRTYYIRTDGNDGNDGLSDSPTGAFKHFQTALDKVGNLAPNHHTMLIKAGAESGVRTFVPFPTGGFKDVLRLYKPWHGPGVLHILGDTANPNNCILQAANESGAAAYNCRGGGTLPAGLPFPGPIIVEGFRVQATWGIRHSGRTDLSIGHMVFGESSNAHFGTEWWNATLHVHAPVTIAGSSQQVVYGDAGQVRLGAKMIFDGNLTFSHVIYAQHAGFVYAGGASFFEVTPGSSVTGGPARVIENATLKIAGPLSSIPSTAPAETATGGQIISS